MRRLIGGSKVSSLREGALGQRADAIRALRGSLPAGGLEQAVLDFLMENWIFPASVKHHHCHPGGLLQHTLEVVVEVSHELKGEDEGIRRLALAAALAHDIGKVMVYKVIFPDHGAYSYAMGPFHAWVTAKGVRDLTGVTFETIASSGASHGHLSAYLLGQIWRGPILLDGGTERESASLLEAIARHHDPPHWGDGTFAKVARILQAADYRSAKRGMKGFDERAITRFILGLKTLLAEGRVVMDDLDAGDRCVLFDDPRYGVVHILYGPVYKAVLEHYQALGDSFPYTWEEVRKALFRAGHIALQREWDLDRTIDKRGRKLSVVPLNRSLILGLPGG